MFSSSVNAGMLSVMDGGRQSSSGVPVTVAVTWSSFHGRRIVMGILRYLTENPGRWSVNLLADPRHLIQSVRQHGSRGVIAAPITTGRSLRELVRRGMRAVVGVLHVPDWSGVIADIDEAAVGRMAAEHLLNQGHQHFAVFEHPWHFAIRRAQAFRRRVAEAGFKCHRLIGTTSRSDLSRSDRMYIGGADRLARALLGLPRPLAVFGPNDNFAYGIAKSCLDAGLRVPEDVAILGVDNDPMPCQLMSRPPLSSIDLPFEQLGYLAADALDRLLTGRKVGRRLLAVQPIGVVVRQSTDLLAVQDAQVAAALRFVRENAHAPHGGGITPDDVLAAVPISRRSLERRFRGAIGRTMMSEIHRVRIDRAKEMLRSTDLRTSEIAERTGFLNASRLAIVFRRITGLTPRQYRRGVIGPRRHEATHDPRADSRR